MCLNSWIPLVRSTCELFVHQQKNNKKLQRDQIVTKREFTRHREIRTENVRLSAHLWKVWCVGCEQDVAKRHILCHIRKELNLREV